MRFGKSSSNEAARVLDSLIAFSAVSMTKKRIATG
jgi:hypothetical protein